jgi:hypothetical protein
LINLVGTRASLQVVVLVPGAPKAHGSNAATADGSVGCCDCRLACSAFLRPSSNLPLALQAAASTMQYPARPFRASGVSLQVVCASGHGGVRNQRTQGPYAAVPAACAQQAASALSHDRCVLTCFAPPAVHEVNSTNPSVLQAGLRLHSTQLQLLWFIPCAMCKE